MRIVLGVDQGLRDILAAREDLGEQFFLKRPNHRADLIDGDHVSIQLSGIVGQVFFQLVPTYSPSLPVAAIDKEPGFDLCALLGDLRANPVHIEVNVDAVSNGLLVVVFHDQVLVEEADGLF